MVPESKYPIILGTIGITISVIVGMGIGHIIGSKLITENTLTIVDSAGRYVEVPLPLERVVVLNSDAAETICILDAENRVIGVNDYTATKDSVTRELGIIFENTPTVGKWYSPSYERIAELHPQIVITYEKWPGPELEETLESLGIKVVRLNCYEVDTLINDIKTIGLMFGKTERANEYAKFIQSWMDKIKDRVKDLEPGERVRVYYESATGYTSNSEGAAHKLITIAGGINIAAAEPVPYPKVSSEWILERDPDVVIKLTPKTLRCGYGVLDTEDLQELMEDITGRTGWQEHMKAVKEGRVHLLSQAVWLGPREVVGMCYLAKWFYPQLFENLDPELIHRTILENFIGLEYKGVFAYP